MSIVKQRGIKYHFLSLWYDSIWVLPKMYYFSRFFNLKIMSKIIRKNYTINFFEATYLIIFDWNSWI